MKILEKKEARLLGWVAAVYVLTVGLSVAWSWAIGVHPKDLSLTVSQYVALHVWTSVLYFVAAAVICTILTRHVRKARLHPAEKWLYFAIFFCVFGCAWFPCNGDRSELVEEIHNWFSYALVLLLALSFAAMAWFARSRGKRIFGICSCLFTVYFIAAYAAGFSGFKETVFIWENVLIALLFFGLLPDNAAP